MQDSNNLIEKYKCTPKTQDPSSFPDNQTVKFYAVQANTFVSVASFSKSTWSRITY